MEVNFTMCTLLTPMSLKLVTHDNPSLYCQSPFITYYGTKYYTVTNEYLDSDFEILNCTFYIFDTKQNIFTEYVTPLLQLSCKTKQVKFNDNYLLLKADAIISIKLSNCVIVQEVKKENIIGSIPIEGVTPNDNLEYLIICLG